MNDPIESKKFDKQSTYTVIVASLVVVMSGFLLSMSLYYFYQMQDAWETHNHRATTISTAIAHIEKDMGYGGFIHNFKNLILRRDIARYQQAIEKNIHDLKQDFELLNSLLVLPENRAALAQLQSTLDEYFEKYQIALALIKKGKSSAEIDEVVKIPDIYAIEARQKLLSSIETRAHSTELHAKEIQKNALTFMQIGGAVILIAILAATSTILIFIRRLTLANTKILKSQSTLDTMLASAPDPTLTVSKSGKIVHANLMATKLFGYSEAEFENLEIEQLLPEKFRAKHKHYRQNFFSTPTNRLMGQGGASLYALTKDGRELNAEISLSYSNAGDEQLVMVAIRDVTEQYKIRNDLINAKTEKLETIRNMTAGIAHNLNTLLGTISGYAQLSIQMLSANMPEKTRYYQDEILKSGARAAEIIQQLEIYSKPSGSDSEIKSDEQSLILILNETIAFLRESIPPSIELNVISEEKNINTKVISFDLQKILGNLILNAQEAIDDQGKIDIEIGQQNIKLVQCSSCHQKFFGKFLSISITDNGKGIHESILNQIFDPFFTTKGLANRKGMGLSLVHGIVHKHNGHILVKSEPNTQTTFSILLPTIQN